MIHRTSSALNAISILQVNELREGEKSENDIHSSSLTPLSGVDDDGEHGLDETHPSGLLDGSPARV